jgi:hypothetical protein
VSKLRESFRQAYLQGESRSSGRVDDLASGKYDLLIATSSWDRRCVSLLEAEISAAHGIGVFFENRGKLGLRDEHDPAIESFLKTSCREITRIEKPSEDLVGLWQQLWTATLNCYRQQRHPLHVLLDLSTCPRYYAMAFLAQGLHQGILASLTCFYAEGIYPPDPTENPGDQFTAGRWETRSVPMLAGTADPGNDRVFVVSVGFEGPKTFRVVSSDDPDHVVVLLPDPAVQKDYVDRTRKSNRLLFEEYGVGEKETLRAPAADAIAAWKTLSEANLGKDDVNLFYLCSGTKPHSMAMALHAQVEQRPTVLYPKPVGHRETEIAPSGTYWAYVIRDLALPSA